jgi:predicted dehydrogenase
MSTPIRVGVIGVGHLGSIHARVFSQLEAVQLVAVCDIAGERARSVAVQHGCEAVTDPKDLLGRVDAVTIAVPTQAHFSVAKPFLAAGIHALVEKPFTRTLPEADQLLRIARRSEAVLQVGHVERFNAALRRVHRLLTDPQFIEVHRLAPFQPRGTEVGVVLDLMIHDLDILLWLVKSPVRRVEAVGVRVLTPFEDIANARVTFRNGAVANLTASRISKEAMRKFRIFQPEAYVSIDFLGQAVDFFRRLPTGQVSQIGQIQHERMTISGEEPLRMELSGFLESIRRRTKPPVSGEEAHEALALALKITRLIHQNPP